MRIREATEKVRYEKQVTDEKLSMVLLTSSSSCILAILIGKCKELITKVFSTDLSIEYVMIIIMNKKITPMTGCFFIARILEKITMDEYRVMKTIRLQ